MLKTISLILLSVALFVDCEAKKLQPISVYTPENILWWLPENTETVVVAKNSYTIINHAESENVDLRTAMKQFSFGSLSAIQDRRLIKPLLGHTVLLSVEGGRKFHPPSNLGSMLFEGCDVLIFGQDFAKIRDSYFNSAESHATAVQKIAGFKVMVFEEKLENDLWEIFIVSPKPNILICATNQDYLTEVLNRMMLKGKKRAIPDDLPEWKQVDTKAQFWAIRHYDRQNAKRDTTSPLFGEQAAANVPDNQAIGITFSILPNSKNEARIRYLSTNGNAVGIANTLWNQSASQVNPKISKVESGVVEIVAKIDNPEDYAVFLFSLFAALGHALYI
jgi:hypothetical protein